MAKKGFKIEDFPPQYQAQISGKIDKGIQTHGSKVEKPPKKPHKGLLHIKSVMQSLNIPYIEELKFCKTRRFRFDVAIPIINIAIEFEGIMAGKSRHTTVTGYTKDCEKYNLAICEGWRVLRYTIMNYTQVENDIKQIIEKNI